LPKETAAKKKPIEVEILPPSGREKSNRNLKMYQPGQSGNPKGRPKGKPLRDALLEQAALIMEGTDMTKLRGIARALFKEALDGDVHAINSIADRLDGKAVALVGADDERPMITEVRHLVVHHDGTNV
jgi:hypothetical protein